MHVSVLNFADLYITRLGFGGGRGGQLPHDLALSPGPGEGPGIHCMRMRQSGHKNLVIELLP